MPFKLIEDIVKLALIVAFLYLAFSVYLDWKQPSWASFAEKRRFAILLALVLAVAAIKVGEDAITRESDPFDLLALRFIHASVPPTLTGIFEVATLSGSGRVIAPLAMIIAVALLCAKRRFEALLLAISVASGAVVVYVLKALVDRDRPRLWDTAWYWGSSFPSGHTLVVTALATAAVISAGRIWPRSRGPAMLIAFIWVLLVATSRLVLGVHWPTDVLAAICIGMFLPLATGIALDSWHA